MDYNVGIKGRRRQVNSVRAVRQNRFPSGNDEQDKDPNKMDDRFFQIS
jgi:hypothetical protein